MAGGGEMMSRARVAILGVTGMLGSVTLDSFAREADFDVIATYRAAADAQALASRYPAVEFRELDAETIDATAIAEAIQGADWVVNAIGIIKPYIRDDDAGNVERAVRVNAMFPHSLGKVAAQANTRVIQIATDCVYSGERGRYSETDLHDALDVYGKSKSLGEAYLECVHHVRCSIVGPELKAHSSLMDWFLGQPEGAEVNGFTNHQWNGVTTLHFARICQGIIRTGITCDHLQHVVPGDVISKAALVKSFAQEFGRADIRVIPTEAPKVIDRTLVTNNEGFNTQIWQAAGYDTPPSIEEMVAELARYREPAESAA
jgi:dTDP-4-dehydrorhamnose reductase